MVVEHIVLLKIKSDTSEEQLLKIETGLYNLKTEIPGIIDISFGADFSGRSQGFSHGLVVRFESKEASVAYQTHPAHASYRDNVLKPFLGGDAPLVLACDYEFAKM
jgi:hypothetical protein|tara:strand:- start:216 stop:533 length:318 start_codon:yes stop_codon:yes gene_type:complete